MLFLKVFVATPHLAIDKGQKCSVESSNTVQTVSIMLLLSTQFQDTNYLISGGPAHREVGSASFLALPASV